MQTDCIILGGGASGLAACAALADTGLRIAVVERLDRVGKKLMAAGNGRCNISNRQMNASLYGLWLASRSFFGKNAGAG